MSTHFTRCENGHYYNAGQFKTCPYCIPRDSDYTQYVVNSNDDEAVTVRSPKGSEYSEQVVHSTDFHGRNFNADEDVTVRYTDVQKQQELADGEHKKDAGRLTDKDTVTVKLSEARYDSDRIDPVAIALSDEGMERYSPNAAAPWLKYDSVEQRQIQTPDSSQQPGFLQPVGWLICIEGPDFGKTFPLKEGRNTIGRSDEMDVRLKNDLTVSRKNHAWIEYCEADRSFTVSAGEARKLVYVNDDLLLMPLPMEKNDVLAIGDSILMLIPCCDEFFSWKSVR